MFNELGQKVLERKLNYPSKNTISVRDFSFGNLFSECKN